MSSPDDDDAIELVCSEDGRVLDVVQWHANVAPAMVVTFAALVDSASVDKAREFLRQLVLHDGAYDWELNVPTGGTPACFHFAGRKVRKRLWIVAARNRRRLLFLLERGSRGNKNAAIVTAQDRALSAAATDGFAYDELTRVNNEMASLQREVAKRASELERLNRRKNELLGMAAHDLRNPVAAIHAYSDLLETELSSSLDPERLEFLKTITTTSKFLLELVNDLLDFATIEAGEVRLRLARTDLIALVRSNVRLNRVLARKKQIAIGFTADIEHAEVEIDARKLPRVVDNLLANAVKFSPAQSSIDVGVRSEPERHVVTVADRGFGIPPEERDQLFQPFHRGGSPRTASQSGTGLGLAICRRIVTGHGGTIWVESNAEKGSTFSFAIPRNA